MHTESGFGSPAAGREGFALALVVFLLFGIALAGAAGYRVVATEAFQSQQAAETELALAVAQGGMEWFMGNLRGTVPATVTYGISGGTAVITTRKIAALTEERELYLVRSEGSYTDPRYPAIPATRVVSQYAMYQKVPVNVMAPVMTTSNETRGRQNGRVYGADLAAVGSCASAVGATLTGVVGRTWIEEDRDDRIVGSPDWLVLPDFDTVVDSLDTAWGIYTDPDFPVDFDGSWPGSTWFAANPDSFPVVRLNGTIYPDTADSGRGTLIVNGQLRVENGSEWTWNGIIIAADFSNFSKDSKGNIYGVLVGGVGAAMEHRFDINGSTIQYHSCYVEKAGLSLAHLTPVENSWWEGD